MIKSAATTSKTQWCFEPLGGGGKIVGVYRVKEWPALTLSTPARCGIGTPLFVSLLYHVKGLRLGANVHVGLYREAGSVTR